MKTFAVYVENEYIGGTEFVIMARNGRYEVDEEVWRDNFDTVFTGTYKACVKYLENRRTDYLESTIG